MIIARWHDGLLLVMFLAFLLLAWTFPAKALQVDPYLLSVFIVVLFLVLLYVPF